MRKVITLLFVICAFNFFAQDTPDKMPEYPGGDKAMAKFIKKNMKRPKSMWEDKEFMGCKCDVRVTINEQGKPINPKIVHSCEHWMGSNDETLRLIDLMPNWKPATKDGKPVAVTQMITIFFNKP